MAAVIGQWRIITLVLGVIGALALGYWINGRLARAKEADALETKFAESEKALVVLRAAQVLLSAQISDKDKALEAETREVIKYVPQYIVGDCTLEPFGVHELNKARGVPTSAGGIIAPTSKTNPAP